MKIQNQVTIVFVFYLKGAVCHTLIAFSFNHSWQKTCEGKTLGMILEAKKFKRLKFMFIDL